jgi:flagellar hook protein FlgE
MMSAAPASKGFPTPIVSLTNGSSTNLITNGFTIINSFSDIVPTFLSIDGPGYFVVRDPVSGQLSATRYGPFMFDANGYLTTLFGKRLQGYDSSSLAEVGDLQVASGAWQETNGPYMPTYTIETNGCLVETLSSNSSIVVGQVLLQNFQDPSALAAQGWRFYGWEAPAGPLRQPEPPGTAGTGPLVVGVLEQLTPAMQIGRYAGPPQMFSQGVLAPTGLMTDVGIEGNGFFVVRRTNDNALFATRAGSFYVDGAGYLVHYSGMRFQGYTDSTLTNIGDLQVDAGCSQVGSYPVAYMEGFEIDLHGTITEYLNDLTIIVRGQFLLAGCANPDLIARTNFDLYPIVSSTGLWSPPAPPLTGNLGWLVEGTVEMDQFDADLLAERAQLNFFNQGPVVVTDVPCNLAILGPGFFTVRDPAANTLYATRWGGFQLDASNHLVTTNGWRLQGVTNYNDGQIGDITIDNWPNSSLALTNYSIDIMGNIVVLLSDGTDYIRGQVLLQSYRNPQGLIAGGNGYYSNVTAALPMFTNGLPDELQMAIEAGAVEEPAPPPALQLPPESGLRLFITNVLGGTIESSTDLVHWNAIGQVQGSPDLNVAEFFDTPEATQTFYRLSY